MDDSKLYPPEQLGKALSEIKALKEFAASFMSPIKENSLSTTKPMVRILQMECSLNKQNGFTEIQCNSWLNLRIQNRHCVGAESGKIKLI
jgi:hypothetical protein